MLGVLFMVWCISGAVWFVMFLTGLRGLRVGWRLWIVFDAC